MRPTKPQRRGVKREKRTERILSEEEQEREDREQKQKKEFSNVLVQAKIADERAVVYADAFFQRGLHVLKRLVEVTDEDLKDMGITFLGDRLKIRHVISEAKKTLAKKETKRKNQINEPPPFGGPEVLSSLYETMAIEQQTLFQACENKDVRSVMCFIKSGASPDTPHRTDGTRLVHVAALGNDVEMIRMLALGAKADLELRDNKGWTCLHVASHSGSLQAIEVIIEVGGDIEASDFLHGCRAIHLAAKGNQREAVALLRRLGANVHARDLEYSWNPMAMAIAEGNTDILQDFLSPQDGKDGIPSNILDDHGFSVLHVACMMRQNEALLLLLLSCSEELGGMLEVRDTKFRRTALHLACMKGGLQCVQTLVKFGASIDMTDGRGCSPLYLAAMHCHLDIVTYLLSCGANVSISDQDGNSCLNALIASRNDPLPGEKERVNSLREMGAIVVGLDGFGGGGGGSGSCCGSGDEGFDARVLKASLVSSFLEKDETLLNKKNCQGDYPIHLVAQENNCEVLRIFIEKKASLLVQNANGNTIAHLAAEEGHAELLDFAVTASRDLLNIQNVHGDTPEKLAVGDAAKLFESVSSSQEEEESEESCHSHHILTDSENEH